MSNDTTKSMHTAPTSSSAQRADAMIDWFRGYAERRLNSRVMDERRTLAPYVVLDLGAQGFLGLQVEEAFGGRALDTVDMARVFEQVGAVDVTVAMLMGIHNGLGLRAIQGFAAPELKEVWLPLLATGRLLDNAVSLDALDAAVCATEATGALVTRVAELVDAGEAPKAAYLVCKTTAPERLWEVLDALAQMLGGRGYMEPNDVPRFMRDARVLRVFEGPTEPIQATLGALALSRPPAVTEFVGRMLGGEAIAADANAACAELAVRYATRPFPAEPQRTQWLEQRAGEIVSWACLLAAAAGTDARTVAWARGRYEAVKAAALSWEGPLPDPEALLARVARCTAAIGDVEQTLPGEATGRDPYLTRDWPDTDARA